MNFNITSSTMFPLYDPGFNLSITDPDCLIKDTREGYQMYTTYLVANSDDLKAGATLLTAGIIELTFTAFVSVGLFKQSAKMPAFAFLAVMTVLQCLEYILWGFYLGLIMLVRNNLFPYKVRIIGSIINNAIWFPMCFHYILIAISRLLSIAAPSIYDTKLTRPRCFQISFVIIAIGLLFVLVLHVLPQYQYVYFSYATWGLYVDRIDCAAYGVHMFWQIWNPLIPGISGAIYIVAIVLLCKLRLGLRKTFANAESGITEQKKLVSVEAKMLMACLVNAIFFLSCGYVTTFVDTLSFRGNWPKFINNLFYGLNSVADPIMYIIFSSELRLTLVEMIRGKAKAILVPLASSTVKQDAVIELRGTINP